MRNLSAPLIAFLNSNQTFRMADLFQLTLSDGTVLRYTSWDTDIIYGGNTFSSSGPVFSRSKIRTVLGVEVDTLHLSITPTPSDTISSVPFLPAVLRGALDGCALSLQRVFMDGSNVVQGGYLAFLGNCADIELNRETLMLTVNSVLEILNIKLPRNLYQPGCLHALYDADCTVSRAAFKVPGTVAVSPSRTELDSLLGQASGYFDMGYVQLTSGSMSGTKRTVKSFSGGVFMLLNPLISIPSAGTTFDAYPGCDKTQATCTTKFSNLVNFRGFPFIPQPETSR